MRPKRGRRIIIGKIIDNNYLFYKIIKEVLGRRIMLKFIDIHCHLIDYFETAEIERIDPKSKVIHVSTALNKHEIEIHNFIKTPYWFAGLHPQDAIKPLSYTVPFVELICKTASLGIGEIGLDRNYPDLEKQIELLEMQLDKALDYKMVTLYHLVGHEYKFIELQKEWQLPSMKIMHGFNSSHEVYQELDKLGFYFSISNRLLKNPKRKETVKSILESKRFFLESDAPYDGGLDEVIKIAVQLRDNYNIGMDEIKEIVNKNFEDLLEDNRESRSQK